jgi:uncharacterized protein YndB with AHSA1/START domain
MITVHTIIRAPKSKVWEYWNGAKHITGWAFASDDWEAPAAENDLQVGGKLKVTMSAKDKSASFVLVGTYHTVEKNERIEYTLDDGRRVQVEFMETPEGTQIVENFDPENENPLDMQHSGWQAILNNFKKYAERDYARL